MDGVATGVSDRVVVLDGGLATELEAAGHDLSDRLWSARLLVTDPDAIEAVHLAYYRAGAQVATTASYQASVEGFAAMGLDRAAAIGAIKQSVMLAKRARERYAEGEGATSTGLLVAGSVGPYGAMLADGSEYTGDYDPGPRALADFHQPRIEALLEAGVDLLALETIPTVREAEVLIGLLAELGGTAWLSYTCRDAARTAGGDPIETAISVGSAPGVVAVGVNCTAPRHLPTLLARAGAVTERALIAYPNRGDRWDPARRHWSAESTGRYDPATVAGWTASGATWLGGCCGTTPADIRALAELVRPAPAAA